MRHAQSICTVHYTSIAFLFYFFQLFNFVRCKEFGSSVSDCATPFHMEESRTTDSKPPPALPSASWLVGKEESLHVGEARSWWHHSEV